MFTRVGQEATSYCLVVFPDADEKEVACVYLPARLVECVRVLQRNKEVCSICSPARLVAYARVQDPNNTPNNVPWMRWCHTNVANGDEGDQTTDQRSGKKL